MAESDPLRSTPFLVACNLDGNLQEAKLRQFVPITLSEIKELFAIKFSQYKLVSGLRDKKVLPTSKRSLVN